MKEQGAGNKIDHFNPSDCISAKMMKCNRIVANVFRKHIMQFNITDSQMSIIFVISKAKNTNQKRISELLYLEKSTVNRNLDRLLQKKIIFYTENKELVLTESGKDLVNKIIPHWENAMAEIRDILRSEGESALKFITTQIIK